MILKDSFIIVCYTRVTEMHVGCQLVHNSYQDFLCVILHYTRYPTLLKWLGKSAAKQKDL